MSEIQTVKVAGYENFRTALKELSVLKEPYTNEQIQLNIYFTGNKNENGVSWCPDCNQSEPVVTEALKQFGKKPSIFLIVDVGDRTFWKNIFNPFRLDSLRVQVIPTLLRWNTPCRLDGDYCKKSELLEMFFLEDE